MPSLAHENLIVYQRSIEFVAWVHDFIAQQLDRAALSIPVNLADGNGKFTGKDKIGRKGALTYSPREGTQAREADSKKEAQRDQGKEKVEEEGTW